MERPNLFDRVALLRSIPEKRLERGDVGTVVDLHGDSGVELEFVDPDGSWRALVGVNLTDCLPLHLPPPPAAVSGVVDSLWYWYDPALEVLEIRHFEARGQEAQSEVAPTGHVILRDPRSGRAVGIVVRGFPERFTADTQPPARPELEQRVRSLGSTLAAA